VRQKADGRDRPQRSFQKLFRHAALADSAEPLEWQMSRAAALQRKGVNRPVSAKLLKIVEDIQAL
jgi:hypothetical protein